MLINGHRAEELRVAIISEGVLDEYQVEMARAGLSRGNIYRGVVTGVHSGLNAAFVKFGGDRDGFLAGHDIVADAYHKKPPEGEKYPRVEEVLQKGQPVIVQVTKDPIGSKGAALTTDVSLAGRYLVLTPFDGSVGISRKVEDEARKEIKEKISKLKLPEGVGCIGRTNAEGQNQRDIEKDLTALLRLWKKIRKEARNGKGPKLLYSDQDLAVSALRDYLDATIKEVVIDDRTLMDKAQVFMKAFMPRSRVKLTFYNDRLPLFSRYGLEEQIEAIYKREVALPSGGSIVIDSTEALTAVDVNSGKFKGRDSVEDTALQTNLEAAEEVARQLRLRDIGGLIVVDFIDMRSSKNQRSVVKAVREAMKSDRARNRAERISANGLMEINRQRIKQALQLQTHRMCPTCRGMGMLPSPDQVGLSLLRRIEARAVSGTVKGAGIKLHPELADAFQNRRRKEILDIEEEFGIQIQITAAPGFHRSQEEILWMEGRPEKKEQKGASSAGGNSRNGDLLSNNKAKGRGRKTGRESTKRIEPKLENGDAKPATGQSKPPPCSEAKPGTQPEKSATEKQPARRDRSDRNRSYRRRAQRKRAKTARENSSGGDAKTDGRGE